MFVYNKQFCFNFCFFFLKQEKTFSTFFFIRECISQIPSEIKTSNIYFFQLFKKKFFFQFLTFSTKNQPIFSGSFRNFKRKIPGNNREILFTNIHFFQHYYFLFTYVYLYIYQVCQFFCCFYFSSFLENKRKFPEFVKFSAVFFPRHLLFVEFHFHHLLSLFSFLMFSDVI